MNMTHQNKGNKNLMWLKDLVSSSGEGLSLNECLQEEMNNTSK